MIWQSTFLMTFIDLLIILGMVWCFKIFLDSRRVIAGRISLFGNAASLFGIFTVALFYLADLVIMHMDPSIIPSGKIGAAMHYLHLNLSWLAFLVGMISLVVGFQANAKSTRSLVRELEISADELAAELDIRKREQDALKESQDRFRDITESMAGWVWEMGPDLRFSWMSTGPISTEFIGKRIEEMVVPEGDQKDWEKYRAAQEAHLPFHDLALGMNFADGMARQLVVSGKPRFESDGSFAGYRGTCRDITDEAEAFRIADDNSRRFLHAIDNIDAQIALYDSESRLVHFNRVYKIAVGPSADRILPGMTLAEVLRNRFIGGNIPEGALGREEEWITERVARFGKSSSPWEFTRDGRTFETREANMPDGGVMVIVSDISSRMKNEISLRESEAQMRLITDAIPVQVAYVDRGNKVQFANRPYADWYGISRDQIIGMNIQDLMGDRAFEQVSDIRDRTLAGEQTTNEAELIARDGRHMHYRATRVPHFREDGNVLGFFLIVVDLSEHIEREALLRHAQKMEAIGQLTGGVAHEFNNLLQVIEANLELTRSRISDDEIWEFVTSALQSVRRGADLTRKLLAFASNQDLNVTHVNLNDLVEHMHAILQRTLGDGVSVDTNLVENLWPVLADAGQVESALLNLSLNARDAMPDGGAITVTTSNRFVDNSSSAQGPNFTPGQYVMLEVADNGAGIPPEILERVFEPFFTTKAVGQGTGLGLSMVHGFADQSGGLVEINSEVGQGTQIRIFLPRADGPQPAMPEPSEQHDIQSPLSLNSSKTILVVEDDPNVRMAVGQILVDLGCNIVEAEDGKRALSVLGERTDINILFTDIVLPGGLNGPEIAKQARMFRPDLKVLFSTGYSNTGGRGGYASEANSWFLQKPYSARELMDTLSQVLSA
jgi:PAS domain S-box-containing protein